jgi:hypothetical protein
LVVAFHLHNSNNHHRQELTLTTTPTTIDVLRHFHNSNSHHHPNSHQQGHNSNRHFQGLVLEGCRRIVVWLIDLLSSVVAAAAEVAFVDPQRSSDAPFRSKCLPITPTVPFRPLMVFLDHLSCTA